MIVLIIKKINIKKIDLIQLKVINQEKIIMGITISINKIILKTFQIFSK